MATVRDIMLTGVAPVRPEDTTESVLRVMRDHGLPVAEHGRLIGVVTRVDVLDALIDAD